MGYWILGYWSTVRPNNIPISNIYFYFFFKTSAIAFSTNGVESLRISAAQNVGIGTTTPKTALEVAGTISGSLVREGHG